jgi:hypothetical protein
MPFCFIPMFLNIHIKIIFKREIINVKTCLE